MKTLFIHIGTPKTGTSAIQAFLDQNRKTLYDVGYLFRDLPFQDYRQTEVFEDEEGRLVIRESKENTRRKIPAKRNGFFLHGFRSADYREINEKRLEEGLALIGKWFQEKDNIILTDEAIWYALGLWDFMKRVSTWSKEQQVCVKIIVFLRPQNELLDSSFRQRVDRGGQTVDWDTFFSWENLQKSYAGLNYKERLSYLRDIFGKEALLVHAYEPKEWTESGESIFSIFLKDLGISDAVSFTIPTDIINISLSHNQAEIKRVLNRLLDWDQKETVGIDNFFRQAGLHASALHPDQANYRYLAEEERAAFMKKYDEGNREVAREYLDREELFTSAAKTSEKWVVQPDSMQEDIILYFGRLNQRLHQEILKQKEENESLKRASLGYRLRMFLRRLKARFKRSKVS